MTELNKTNTTPIIIHHTSNKTTHKRGLSKVTNRTLCLKWLKWCNIQFNSSFFQLYWN